MCLRYRGIDDDKIDVSGVRRAQGHSDNNKDVNGGRGTDDVSEVSETMAEAAGA